MDASIPFPIQETGLVDRKKRISLLQNENTLALKKEVFDNDAIIFDNIKAKELKLYNPKTNRGIIMNYQDFNNLVLWSNNHGNFIAIEPWSGMSTYLDEDNVFEHKENIRIISANSSEQLQFEIAIL